MTKLPKEIVLEEIHKVNYTYGDFVEMFEDIQRLRRKTGWCVMAIADISSKNLTYLVAGDEGSAAFQIPLSTLSITLWPTLYPDKPEVAEWRRIIFGRGGVDRIAAILNDTPKEPNLEGPTVLDRILGEEDF